MTDPTRPAPGSPTNDGTDPAMPPALRYIRMFTDDAGESALAPATLGGFALQTLGGAAAAMWMQRLPGIPVEVWFTVLPVGWIGEWHESPGPQWVTALSGRWWIETADGRRVEMGPGEIHWGEDQGTTSKRGHRSGQIGDLPCVQLMVRYRSAPDLAV
jgi:hypothetical protein